jgi:Ca-activated chloride channel family protein
VTDSNGVPVTDVKQEEFRLLEDDIPQTISFLYKEEPSLNYCLVFDVSGSIRKSSNQVIEAAQIIVRGNKPNDETSLIAFSDQSELLEKFTTRKDTLLRHLSAWRGINSRTSAVVDAVYLATKHVAEYKPVDRLSRRAVVLITDGNDNSSHYRLDELRKLLRKENVQVFAIGYDLNEIGKALNGPYTQRRAKELLMEITKETGGQADFPESAVELEKAAGRILNTLRTQYVIGYTPSTEPKEGSYHKVSVSVIDSPARDRRLATTRSGYVNDSRK